jgi:hypothetical protein
MKIDPKKIKHLDAECKRLTTLFESISLEKIFKGGLKAFTNAKSGHIDMTEPFVLRQGDSIWWCENGQRIGFDKTNTAAFRKLVNLIYKDPSVNPYISHEYLLTKTFECLVNARNGDNNSMIFSGILLENMEGSIRSYNVYLKLIKLNVNKKFKVGDVEIGRFKKNFFDKHIVTFKRKFESADNIYEWYREIFSEQTYAMVYIRAESQRAKEIALGKCSLAIDLLKICSETVIHPKQKIHFDIDSNAKLSTHHSVLLENLENDGEITAQIQLAPNSKEEPPFELNEQKKRKLDMFTELLKKFPVEKERTELQRLVIRSIHRFGAALSEQNLYRRIADLFTVLESLLLVDQNSPIMESVSKYLSKLVYKRLGERKECIALIKKMYGVRSRYLHHADEVPFEIQDLASLQVNVFSVLTKMIIKSIDYKTKEELFQEIEDAIIAAYTPKIFRN